MWLISSHGEAVNVQLESCTVSLSDTNLTVSRYEHARRYRVLVLHVVWYACRSLRSVRCGIGFVALVERMRT